MIRYLKTLSLLATALLAVACSPVATATDTAPMPQAQVMKAKAEQLVTTKDISKFTRDLGITNWEMDEEMIGEYRAYRTFYGQSWSVNRNLAVNCIWQLDEGVNLQGMIDWLVGSDQYPADTHLLTSRYEYAGEFQLRAYQAGHTIFDAFLVVDGFLYWADLDVGTSSGATIAYIFGSEEGERIDAFLNQVLMTNLERGK